MYGIFVAPAGSLNQNEWIKWDNHEYSVVEYAEEVARLLREQHKGSGLVFMVLIL